MANTKEQISRNMRSNKCKDTKPELLLRKELRRRGLRYRKKYKALEGKPDIVFLRAQIAVFVDGKMWHGYEKPWMARASGNGILKSIKMLRRMRIKFSMHIEIE